MKRQIECLSGQELENEATRDWSVVPDDTVEDLANNLRGLIILDQQNPCTPVENTLDVATEIEACAAGLAELSSLVRSTIRQSIGRVPDRGVKFWHYERRLGYIPRPDDSTRKAFWTSWSKRRTSDTLTNEPSSSAA
jgi:hypothetical protein